MEQAEQMSALKGLPLLKRIPEGSREDICRIILDLADHKEFADGEPLMHEGHLAFETGYVVLDGAVEVKREGLETIELTAPTLLGEMSQFIEGDERTATVHAKGNVNALSFSWDDFHDEIRELLSEDVHRKLIDALERVVWERFDLDPILSLALFHDLDDELKLRVCLPFPWITERQLFKVGGRLFKEGDRCKGQGFLITHGSFNVYRGDGSETIVRAPNIIGVIPAPNAELKWSATADARKDAEVLRFSWEDYTEKLNERLSKEDKSALVQSMKNHSSKHFRH